MTIRRLDGERFLRDIADLVRGHVANPSQGQ